jgi:hypothetical protein
MTLHVINLRMVRLPAIGAARQATWPPGTMARTTKVVNRALKQWLGLQFNIPRLQFPWASEYDTRDL